MGYMEYRAWARFCQTEGVFIAQALIKRAIIPINSDNLINIFQEWMREI
ncbi:MAG: hypothetical protein RLZZ338_4014 [Cyanobacteriota bacterium]